MRVVRMSVVALLVLGAAACGSSQSQRSDQKIMPKVTGQQLDLAESNLENAGIDPTKLKIIGGGTFGIIAKSNWQVCTQRPAPGEAVSSAPRLEVERTCPLGKASAGAVQQTTVPTTSSMPSTPTTVTDQGKANAMEKTFLVHLANNGIQSIASMCDASYTHWSCFYDGVTDGAGDLRVNLSTDGGWSADDLNTMADQAGRHWFNFIACDYPDLTTIVVAINGMDHNVFRSDTKADLTC